MHDGVTRLLSRERPFPFSKRHCWILPNTSHLPISWQTIVLSRSGLLRGSTTQTCWSSWTFAPTWGFKTRCGGRAWTNDALERNRTWVPTRVEFRISWKVWTHTELLLPGQGFNSNPYKSLKLSRWRFRCQHSSGRSLDIDVKSSHFRKDWSMFGSSNRLPPEHRRLVDHSRPLVNLDRA